jgi:lipoate-protein ligase B
MLPCGIEGRSVTSIEKVLTERGESQHHVPSIKDISAHVLAKMQHVFDMEVNTNVIELE